jgi:Pyridoxamine 5'-phosphate oxidase
MAKFYTALTQPLMVFIQTQPIFFVATAPIDGRINLSPKGMNTFRCLSENQVAYLDLTGSGNETSAHLEENGRGTLMFCSFSEEPLILRLYGQGTVIRPHAPQWEHYATRFDLLPGARQIILLQIEQVQTSCGFGVPLLTYQGDRPTLIDWATQKGEDGVQAYQRQKNQHSIDGLPTHLLKSSGTSPNLLR